jgi:drug/metabolite transporter (DMT)-like permease
LILTCVVFGWKNYAVFSKISRKQWFNLVIIGLVGGSIPFLLFFKGLSMTSAAQGGFIHKSMFIFTAFLAMLILKEKINKTFILGGALLFLGNFVVLNSFHLSLGRGDLLIFLAVLLWSAENILSKKALNDLEGKVVAWGRMFFGSVFILFFLFFSGQGAEIFKFNFQQFGWIALTSVLLFFYVITWYSGLKLVPVSVAMSILVLGSPITTLLSAVYSGKITNSDLYSSALIISGIIIILGSDYIMRQVKNINSINVRP